MVPVFPWTVNVRVSLVMNVCIVRMGFVYEPAPTQKSAAVVSVSTQVYITVA